MNNKRLADAFDRAKAAQTNIEKPRPQTREAYSGASVAREVFGPTEMDKKTAEHRETFNRVSDAQPATAGEQGKSAGGPKPELKIPPPRAAAYGPGLGSSAAARQAATPQAQDPELARAKELRDGVKSVQSRENQASLENEPDHD